MTVSALHTAWKGNPVITISDRFDFQLFLDLVKEHQPHRAHLVPPILVGLAKSPLVDNYVNSFSSIKLILSAAAPLGIEIENIVKERLGCNVKQGWGMSELSPLGTVNPDADAKPGSIGPLVPSTYGKIIDETGKSLGPNTPGELAIKGPQVMMVGFRAELQYAFGIW
jgi:4-coumarate--CoA ligase